LGFPTPAIFELYCIQETSMEIPLVLRQVNGSTLSYAIPLWYRAVMGAILALILGSLLLTGGPPGLIGWVFVALSLFATLYEERWVFDVKRGELRHRFGLIVAARTLKVPFDSITTFRIRPYVRGTLPGSEDERAENERTLAESRGIAQGDETHGKRRPIYKKSYLSLICEGPEGSLLLNMVAVRKGPRLRADATRIAEFCQVPLEEG
jgi:hypothetical protein